MLAPPLPLELLTEIFKCIENDYKTLYSCILVNKNWHNINIPILWRNPFYSENSIKVIINCLLTKYKDFLAEIDVQPQLLDKPPMLNYAKYATELDLLQSFKINKERWYRYHLVNFILDHSTAIRKLKILRLDCEWIICHHRFNICFRNLHELSCDLLYNSKFLDQLTKVCKNIQILKIRSNVVFTSHDINAEHSLIKLIKAQNQIKRLAVTSLKKLTNFKEAISIHSESIIIYESHVDSNFDSLIPTFNNLKILKLTNFNRHVTNFNGNALNTKVKSLRSALLPNIQEIHLDLRYQPFLLDLSNFIKINGKNLRILKIGGKPIDEEFLGAVIQSIGQYCKNLERLSVFYKNELDAQLIELLNNCINLKIIKINKAFGYKNIIDGDKIFAILNQSSPKNLNTIQFKYHVSITDDSSLNVLMNNWKGSMPFNLILKKTSSVNGKDGLDEDLLKKYQDLGFLNYRF